MGTEGERDRRMSGKERYRVATRAGRKKKTLGHQHVSTTAISN